MARKKATRKVATKREKTSEPRPVQFSREHADNLDELVAEFIDRGPIHSVEELIANSSDADANNVWITYDKPGDLLIIEDDGRGMIGKEIDGFFRMGGSKKRDLDRTEGGRKFMGNYGVGAILVGRLSSEYELVTTKEGIETTVPERFGDGIPKLADGTEIDVDPELHGTKITMRGLKFGNRNDFEIEDVIRTYQWELELTPDFRVHINGEEIQPRAIETGKEFSVDATGDNVGEVTGTIYYTGKTSGSSGIHIRVNNRRVGDPKALLKKYANRTSMLGRTVAFINADGLADSIDFGRTAFRENTTAYAEFESILEKSLREVARFSKEDSAGKSIAAVSRKADTLAENVQFRLTKARVGPVDAETVVLLDTGDSENVGAFDLSRNTLTINRNHPQVIVSGSMNAAQYEQALLDAAIGVLAQHGADSRGGTLYAYLDEQRKLWKQLKGIGEGGVVSSGPEISPNLFYEPKELGRLGIFGGNTLKDMIAVGIIRNKDISSGKIRGSAYEGVVGGLDGFISLVDLCNRESSEGTQDRIRKTKLVLDHAADNSRPFVYCFTDETADNELYLLDQTVASRVHTYATTLSMARGDDGPEKNRQNIRQWFHQLGDSYANLSELETHLERVDGGFIRSSIEQGNVRKRQHSYRIGDVITAIQTARGNDKILARIRA